MSDKPDALDVDALLSEAVRYFWTTRSNQRERQGSKSGHKDAGARAAVTGGKHADGFVNLIAQIARHAGMPDASIHATTKRPRTLPGYFRPGKEWDLTVVQDGALVAAVEVKSQVGSFGNNFNNRVEEALGNARDFWMAVSKEKYGGGGRPWLGYFFMLEESEDSQRPTKAVDLAPFAVEPAFQGLSYAQRYEEVCRRMLLERDYDAACFFTSNRVDGSAGRFTASRVPELTVQTFARSLHAHIAARSAIK